MPFRPEYTITDKILNNLTAIAAVREVIEQAHLVPKWEAKLRRQALLHNTHSSTAIEGNKLTLEQVEALVEGKDVMPLLSQFVSLRGRSEATDEAISTGKIASSQKALLAMTPFENHISNEDSRRTTRVYLDTSDVMRNATDSGVFRNRQVFVGKRIFDGTTFKEVVEYMPPKTEEVPQLAQEFIDWLNLDKSWGLNPVLLAGIVHYEIARVHPFIDGNGRTARLLATAILYLSGFDHRRIFALDDYYDRDRQAYYAALKTAQQGNGDITLWLEYFTDGILYPVKEAKDAVLKVGPKKKSNQAQIALTPKQMQIVEYINIHRKVANKDLQDLFKISAQAVHKELTKLIELKVIKSMGEGRALHYILV